MPPVVNVCALDLVSSDLEHMLLGLVSLRSKHALPIRISSLSFLAGPAPSSLARPIDDRRSGHMRRAPQVPKLGTSNRHRP